MAQGEHGIVLAEGDHVFAIVRESTVELTLGNESLKIHYDTDHAPRLAEELRRAADGLVNLNRDGPQPARTPGELGYAEARWTT